MEASLQKPAAATITSALQRPATWAPFQRYPDGTFHHHSRHQNLFAHLQCVAFDAFAEQLTFFFVFSKKLLEARLAVSAQYKKLQNSGIVDPQYWQLILMTIFGFSTPKSPKSLLNSVQFQNEKILAHICMRSPSTAIHSLNTDMCITQEPDMLEKSDYRFGISIPVMPYIRDFISEAYIELFLAKQTCLAQHTLQIIILLA